MDVEVTDQDRLQRMMGDPEAYMAEARARAREIVERDIARDRERRREERRAARRARFHIHWWRYDGYDFLRGGIYFCRWKGCDELRYGARR